MLSLGLTYYICLLAELVYPTYASFKAIKSSEQWDDTQWLTYWVVYAFLSTLESLGIAVLQWVPLYYEIKLLFIIWLINPKTSGAKFLYDNYIRPFLEKYGHKIDPVFNQADNLLKTRYVGEFAKAVEKYGPKAAEDMLKYAAANADKLKDMALAAAAAQAQSGQAAAAPAARKDE